MNLSFKCKIYGDRPHTPCSGMTDDGTDSVCECRCHEDEEIHGYPDGEGQVFGETV